MLGFAAALGGGAYIQQKLQDISLPQLCRTEPVTFRLFVRVVSASIPGLGRPGYVSRQIPRLEVWLGDVRKETELADFLEKDETAGPRSPQECPWRFGDTLTFVASSKDVVGRGVKLRLYAHNDFVLGPLQLQLTGRTPFAETWVDLQRRALPACVHDRRERAGIESWESPVMVIPLYPAEDDDAVPLRAPRSKDAVAHITAVFGVDIDPEFLLSTAQNAPRPVTDVLRSRAQDVIKWLDEPIGPMYPPVPGSIFSDGGYYPSESLSDAGSVEESAAPYVRARPQGAIPPPQCPSQRRSRSSPHVSSPSPQNQRAGSRPPLHPNRHPSRHHDRHSDRPPRPPLHPDRPPPARCPPVTQNPAHQPRWDESLTARETKAAVTRARAQSQSDVPRVPSHIINGPDLAPEGWVWRKGPGGRIYWHHLALGPPPWEEGFAQPGAGSIPAVASQPCSPSRSNASGRGSIPVAVSPVSQPCSPSGAHVNEMRGFSSQLAQRSMTDVSFGPLVGPELPLERWVSCTRPGGRTWWHNQALGPVPWENV